jgi:CheY-like chemotaxis protein
MTFPGDCFTTGGIVGAPPEPIMPTDGASRSGGRRILVVEDEAITALAIARTLEQAGFAVLGPAARVAEAIDLLRVSVPDAAVLDVNLFGSPVRPVAEALGARGIPFLFCTGYQDLDQAADVANGAPVLSKPVAAGTLVRALAKLLDHGRVAGGPAA